MNESLQIIFIYYLIMFIQGNFQIYIRYSGIKTKYIDSWIRKIKRHYIQALSELLDKAL